MPQLDRSIIPFNPLLTPYQFPTWETHTFSNGLPVVIIRDSKLPMISVRLMSPFGSFYDGNFPGSISMMMDLAARGTKTWGETELPEVIEILGGRMVAGSQWDESMVFINGLSHYSDKLIQILGELVFEPAFSEAQFNFLIDQRLNALKMNKDSTQYLSSIPVGNVLFPGHPYQFPIQGLEQHVKALTPEILKSKWSHFQANGSVLCLVGDVKDIDLKHLESAFSTWNPKPLPTFSAPPPAPLTRTIVEIVEKPDAVQSTIRIAHHGIRKKEPKVPQLTVMNSILGGYFGSRLNMNLREEKGFTYGIRSGFTDRLLPGFFYILTDVRTEVTGMAVNEILMEMKKLQTEGVSDEEHQNVVNYLVGRFPMELETAEQLSGAVTETILFDLGDDYFPRIRQKISQVSKEDIQQTAKEFLFPETCLVSIAGNSKEIYPLVKHVGPVTIRNADGDLLDLPEEEFLS